MEINFQVENQPIIQNVPYREIIGLLLYLGTISRPDISFLGLTYKSAMASSEKNPTIFEIYYRHEIGLLDFQERGILKAY